MTVSALLRTEPLWAEFLNSLSMIVLGIFLLLPLDTFNLRVYSALASIMNEHSWGATFLALGVLNAASLIWAKPRMRKNLALAMAFLWMLMATSFVISLPFGLLAPLVGCMAINSCMIFIQIGRLHHSRNKNRWAN